MTRSAFRPEIQALRAVAVALVVVYHLWPSAVPGGYAGVDVFFVISGYLITAHLVSEVARTGGVGLWAFWARRIRRLLPAASSVLVFCLIAMVCVVPVSLWQRTVTEIAASAASAQNWVLAAGSVDYLGAGGSPTVVQHYWSLSVEEQFYVVWPLLVVGAAVLPLPRAVSLSTRLATVFAVVLVVSLVFSTELTAHSPTAYFHTGARAWEFAAGGLLATLPPRVIDRMRPAARTAVALAGFAAVAAAAALFTAKTPFPGPWALVPVVGTALVIAAAAPGRLDRLRPVQWLGSVSYPLYLWHWPLIVLTPYVVGAQPGAAASFGILALATLLAWLTVVLVERPLARRRARTAPARFALRRTFALAAAFVMLLVVTASVTTGSLERGNAAAASAALEESAVDPCYGAAAIAPGSTCRAPFAVPPTLDTAFAAADKGSLGEPCSSPGAAVTQCEFGETRQFTHTVALVGNSHAGHLVAALDAYGQEHGWRVILMRKTGCTGTSTSEHTESGCRVWTENVLAELHARDDIDIVAVATNNDSLHYLAPADVSPEGMADVRASIAANLASLVAAGKTVVAIGDVPGSRPTPAPECVYLHRDSYDPCATPVQPERNNIVAEVAEATDGVAYVDLEPYFCDDTCHSIIGGVVVYIDDHHLTASFSRSLAPYLGGAIERTFTFDPPVAPERG